MQNTGIAVVRVPVGSKPAPVLYRRKLQHRQDTTCSDCYDPIFRQVMGAISWIVDTLMYEEETMAAEEEQRVRRQETSEEEREQGEEDGLADQVR